MISNYLVNKMIDFNIIKENDRALYLYGLKEGCICFQNILITVVFSAVFGNFLKTIIFLGAYVPLRSYAGGYHATSTKRCLVYSLGLILILEFYFSYRVMLRGKYLIFALIIAIYIIYKYSPLQSVNKPLSSNEKYHYAVIVKKILFVECGLIMIFSILNLSAAIDGISIALIVEGVLLTVGIFI